jgi:hypothetical protein
MKSDTGYTRNVEVISSVKSNFTVYLNGTAFSLTFHIHLLLGASFVPSVTANKIEM